MTTRSRRRSATVSLVLIGLLAATSGCGQDEQRHVYRTKQECMEDWNDEKECEEIPSSSPYRSHGVYFGPRYYGSAPAGRGIRAATVATISRGGFGGLSHFHGSGRS